MIIATVSVLLLGHSEKFSDENKKISYYVKHEYYYGY